MLGFLEENLLLVLSIIGLVLGFLASISEFVTRRKPVRFLLIVAILGFVISVTYQIYAYNLKQEEARQQAAKEQLERSLQLARDDIIKEINLNVRSTKLTVETIAEHLETTKLNEVAREMVTIRQTGSLRFEETMAFAKGSPDMWFRYADWLQGMNEKTEAPSLSITFNAGHYYDAGLLLAYLLTSQTTRSYLEKVVTNRGKWKTFNADQPYLINLKQTAGQVQWILFYDRSNQNLIGFADAQNFISELMAYHHLGKHKDIEDLLNKQHANPVMALQERFSSIQTAVFRTRSPAKLVQAMIEEQLALAVAAAGPRPYVVHLEKMIRLAASDQGKL